MGALIGCCVFGLVLLSLGFLFLRLQKKSGAIIEFVAGGLFLAGGIFAITVYANEPKSEHYTFSMFKSDYKKAAKVCKIPYTLEDDVRQGAKDTIYFPSDYTVLYITPNNNKEISSFSFTLFRNKTTRTFDDSNYALAVVCAVEGFDSPDKALEFLNSALDLPIGEYIKGKSGYKYFHGLQDEDSIGFNISKTFMTSEEVIKKINENK